VVLAALVLEAPAVLVDLELVLIQCQYLRDLTLLLWVLVVVLVRILEFLTPVVLHLSSQQ
jgi:hypothetical protein